jgi:ATP phosphoribosyltransferase regulatory subunit
VIDLSTIGSVEAAEFSLCALYSKHGYLPFKMSKFEEYDLYVRNKDFLISDNVITFNDTDGRLLAMKPDVTLSIIKNSNVETGCKSKVYYSENVYRVSPRLRRFGELRQTGLECVGDTDIIDTYEVVSLAADSLALISENYVLDLSHLGILSAVISAVSTDAGFKKEATRLLSEKNRHELSALCKRAGAAERPTEILLSFIDLYGEMGDVLSVLAPIAEEIGCMDAYSELERLCMLLSSKEGAERINLDFSVVNDMSYYNGIVFTGFIEGIPDGVLAGGEYGALVQRMGKAAGAVGFAVYLDLLEELNTDSSGYDVDVLIVYDENTAIEDVLEKKSLFIAEGKSVSLQRAIPEKLRYKELVKMEG